MHPRRLRCFSLKYSRYSRSSRLAGGAPRPSRCDARLSPRAAWPRRVSGLLLLGRLGVPFRLPLFDLGFEVFVGQPDVVHPREAHVVNRPLAEADPVLWI